MARINNLEASVEALDRAGIEARVVAIRDELRAGGSSDDALEEVFAIVREVSFRVLGLRHYDVQIVGGMVLCEGCCAEMATGEGKTLVAGLACALEGLRGGGVFVVTVNDYLAKRDSELIGQVLRYMGVSVGLVQAGMSTAERRAAYAADVTYVTNSELGFDYLRDNLAINEVDVVLGRPFDFCIVDEADSILIDEARTPLIISGKTPADMQKYAVAARAAEQLVVGTHYEVNEKEQSVLLSENGYNVLEAALKVDDLFDPKAPWAPYVTNALKAKEVFKRDVNYIVREEEADVQIVDEFTGRVMEGRRWSDGLHQAVEAKEGLPVKNEATTVASVSYQAFFKLFDRLAAMTGTAATEAEELGGIYGLRVVTVPTALPIARKDYEDVVFKNATGKYRAVMSEIARVAPTGRPVLVGTTSIEASEALSALLTEVEVPHEVLNAKPESAARESEIIAQAGRKFSITLATNMAGRGTDILLGGNAEYYARALARKELVSRNSKLYEAMISDSVSTMLIDDDELPCELTDDAFDMLAAAADTISEGKGELLGDLVSIDEIVAIAAEYGPIPDDFGLGVPALREVISRVKAELEETVAAERAEVIKAGGLYVIGTERADSRRVDNQLRGRAGRQGDPGGSRFFLALDDKLFRLFGGEKVTGLLNAFRVDDNTPIENKSVTTALDNAQKNVEEYYSEIREQLFTYDEVMSTQRAAIYAQRRKVLVGGPEAVFDRLKTDSAETATEIVEGFVAKSGSDVDCEALAAKLAQFYPEAEGCDADSLLSVSSTRQAISEHVQACVLKCVESKNSALESARAGLGTEASRFLVLTQMDNLWQEHMKTMDYLKEFVVLRAYGSDDPLEAYKLEGFDLFQDMLANVRRNFVYSYFQYDPRKKT